MRNGVQSQQTAVMAPPHLNGSAQFISGGYVGYLSRQSWGQYQPQLHRSGGGRPLSHPPPPPPPSKKDMQRPLSMNLKSSSLPPSRTGSHKSAAPSVSLRYKKNDNKFIYLLFL